MLVQCERDATIGAKRFPFSTLLIGVSLSPGIPYYPRVHHRVLERSPVSDATSGAETVPVFRLGFEGDATSGTETVPAFAVFRYGPIS